MTKALLIMTIISLTIL